MWTYTMRDSNLRRENNFQTEKENNSIFSEATSWLRQRNMHAYDLRNIKYNRKMRDYFLFHFIHLLSRLRMTTPNPSLNSHIHYRQPHISFHFYPSFWITWGVSSQRHMCIALPCSIGPNSLVGNWFVSEGKLMY